MARGGVTTLRQEELMPCSFGGTTMELCDQDEAFSDISVRVYTLPVLFRKPFSVRSLRRLETDLALILIPAWLHLSTKSSRLVKP
jgi:hypothetical protein